MPQTHPRLLPTDGIPVPTLTAYCEGGGFAALRHVRHAGVVPVLEEIERAGLRGRGGAGFPTAMKWRGVLDSGSGTRHAVCNGAEGEPGTFKDRLLLRANPYQVLEGLLIAATVIGAPRAFLCLKQSFEVEAARVRAALDELRAVGVLAHGPEVEIVLGPEEYLFGEEKALLEVIEGNLPMPRVLPPYLEGLFRKPPDANPTLVNNVETLANVPHILRHGADWFRQVGTTRSPGTMVFTLTGDVRRPGCWELPLGTPLRVLVEGLGGGVAEGRTLQAIFPGTSNAVLGAADLDLELDFDVLRAAGSGLGAGGFVVYDDTACMVTAAAMYSRFLYVESCGQCPPCKFGSGEITAYLERLARGAGTHSDVDTAHARCQVVAQGNRCALPVGEQVLVESLLHRFAPEFRAHFGSACPRPRSLVLPKIADLDPATGTVQYDTTQASKRPDWTYGPG
ncbi:MAG: NADH-ubiquinone oxidoreductase-F iron-sulfur binding region domain-containing protein [Candidatus Binatia bacterium]